MEKIRIGVIGVGVLGNHHARILSGMPFVSMSGIFDCDRQKAGEVAKKYSVNSFESDEKLFENCDAVVIATPTGTHREVAEKALSFGCDILVEKPLADSTAEGRAIVALAEKKGKILMVGHIEQFNPAFECAKSIIEKPLFVESHRLTAYRGRGIDVSVVHDLLIHDLELLLTIIGEKVVSIEASAKKILTNKPDIANVRLRFEGGCVANLTASRISLSNMRKMRFFQRGAYIGVDFGGKTVEVATLGDGPKPAENADKFDLPGGERVFRWFMPVADFDALTAELNHFIDCVRERKEPRISGRRGLDALELADKIIEFSEE